MAPVVACADERKEFVSPDGQLRALVVPAGKGTSEAREGRIEIYKTGGKLLASKDYISADGSHGWIVYIAAWTPDSNFFMYNMYSSGGHQPWHVPVDFFSRKDNKILSLDKYVGAVTDLNFEVVAPDFVKVIVQKATGANTEIRVSLSMLTTNTGPGGAKTACSAPDSRQLAAWREFLLSESAKLKAEIQKKINYSTDMFIAYPEEGATETQLGHNLSNLFFVAFDLNIIRPIAGAKTPKRVSEGISDTDAIKAIDDVKLSQKYVEEQLTRINAELCRGWHAELAMEEIKLKTSRKFWDHELHSLIESFKRY